MTVLKAQSQQQGRRILPVRAAVYGLAAGLLSALSAVSAAPPTQQSPSAAPPATAAPTAAVRQAPGVASITNIDFKRGDGGSAKLILQFDRDGAMPDLRTTDKGVVVDIGNATMPANLQRILNVADFATPVTQVQASANADRAQIALIASGKFDPLAYQTGRDYIVELVPRASAPQRAVGASAATVASGQRAAANATAAGRAYAGRPVTFNFQDVPVRTVLTLIAEESGLNIVASDTVTGNVSLRLINVPWDQALDIVLQAKSLDKRRNGNVVWVALQSEIAKFEQDKEDARIAIENRAETVTEYIPINYGNAEDIAKLLTDESKGAQSGGGAGGAGAGGGGAQQASRGFLSPRGSLSFDRRTNTLLVIDIPGRVSEIRRLVNQLDKPVDQVLIEARIVIANEDFAREIGAKFGIRGTKDNVSVGSGIGQTTAGNTVLRPGLNVDIPAAPGQRITNSPGQLALTFLNAGYGLDIELSAMQEEGRGEVISNPRVVTSNQREAVIKQGREIGYVTTQSSGGQVTQTVNFKEIFLELKVTPTITNDGRVFMAMVVKKDELEQLVQTVAGQVPLIARREVNTAVLVDDGNTVVIGGVYEFTSRSDIAKVPFLGDVPFLGNLFKKKGRSKEKAELLIFVTPKVVPVAQRL
jgi:type IV pilus assembly protein PilQ